MNGKKIFKVIAVVGLAKLVMGNHRHRTGASQRGNWHDRIAELHRELHRSDAEAMPPFGVSADRNEAVPH